MRELRISSVISVALSITMVAVSGVSLAGGSAGPKETDLLVCAVVGGVVITATSLLFTATESKTIGLVHGTLMALGALAIFCIGIRCLPDSKQWRGGFVEMIQVPVAGGLILFSIAAAGSAFQTFYSVSEKKKGQSPYPTPREMG